MVLGHLGISFIQDILTEQQKKQSEMYFNGFPTVSI